MLATTPGTLRFFVEIDVQISYFPMTATCCTHLTLLDLNQWFSTGGAPPREARKLIVLVIFLT
jgi:hypothetical protein